MIDICDVLLPLTWIYLFCFSVRKTAFSLTYAYMFISIKLLSGKEGRYWNSDSQAVCYPSFYHKIVGYEHSDLLPQSFLWLDRFIFWYHKYNWRLQKLLSPRYIKRHYYYRSVEYLRMISMVIEHLINFGWWKMWKKCSHLVHVVVSRSPQASSWTCYLIILFNLLESPVFVTVTREWRNAVQY